MRRLAAIGIAGGVLLLLLLLAQLILPGLAEQRIRDRLSRYGHVESVSVDAFPAVELLWHQADKVVVRVDKYQSTMGQLADQLAQTADAGTLDATASQLHAGLLTMHDAKLVKHGNELTGSATVTEADLQAAIPFVQNVQPVGSANGQLTMRGTATVLGFTATIDATVMAQNGRLIVQPNVPLGALATFTVFSDPRISVEGVSATSTANGFTVSGQARLR
jgi:hypothetical protein